MNLRLLRKLRILMSPSTFRLRLRSTLKPETAHTSGSQQNDVRMPWFLFFCSMTAQTRAMLCYKSMGPRSKRTHMRKKGGAVGGGDVGGVATIPHTPPPPPVPAPAHPPAPLPVAFAKQQSLLQRIHQPSFSMRMRLPSHSPWIYQNVVAWRAL